MDFYAKPPASNNFYPGLSGFDDSFNDIDLRAEFGTLIWKEGRGLYTLFRKCQFEDGQPKRCVCWSKRTQEPDIDTDCNICNGNGYFFNDFIVRCYKSNTQEFSDTRRYNQTGVENYVYIHFYIQFDAISEQTSNPFDIPTPYDKIIELQEDINGIIVTPLKQLVKYDIISVSPYRLEQGGRIEYYRIRTRASLDRSYLV
jgi:hypothetical protein